LKQFFREKGKYMKIALITVGFIFLTLIFTACGSSQTPAPQTVEPTVVVSPSPVASITPLNTVQELVNLQNEYRESIGEDDLLPGLSCALYAVPNTTTNIIGATGLSYVTSWVFSGTFDQSNAPVTAGLNILPAPLQANYETWYIVKCSGNLVSGDSNWHDFSITSDDGSNLYIDGLLINNDGLHSAQTKSYSKYLVYGFHSFELDYFQGAGAEQLQLEEDGSIMGTSGFYH